jgi:IS1 family transposase
MRSWSLFPPRTQELQLDEKWAFVYKKQKHCDLTNAEDHHAGDCWDHVAFDPEHRLVLNVLTGKRSGSLVMDLVKRARQQLQGRIPRLITTDNFPPYATAIDLVFGQAPRPVPSGQGKKRPPDPPRPLVNYATVEKEYRDGRVVKVQPRVIFGTEQSIAQALEQSAVSTAVNTSFIERHNGTDRHRNARKGRRTYRFSKDWEIHQAVGDFTYYSYNFCWCVRTLATKDARGRRHPRTPALAAGLTDHIWSLAEWLSYPAAPT